MSQKMKRRLAAVLAGFLVFCLMASLVLSLIGNALAEKSSGELAEEHYATELEADEYAQQAEELQRQAEELQRQAKEAISNKLAIDAAIAELESEISDTKAEIQQLNLNIADKQQEYDGAVAEEAAMTEQFKIRLRAMEENGSESYWAVIFRASSLSDLLDQLNMIAEISEADLRMREELAKVRERVKEEQCALELAREARNQKQEELEQKQVLLAEKRVEMDQAIIELCANNELLLAAQDEAERMEAELREKSLELMEAYYNAIKRESAANSSSGVSSSGFKLPVPSGSAFITDAYGYRWHPVKQMYSFHTGVDLACGYGTTIYATKSGTVIESKSNGTYGNYVTIQHTDGSASMYAHMSSTAVSSGDYVSQGSVIGYVGSTGISTGPHLHFEIYINGSTVNPMDYVSLS